VLPFHQLKGLFRIGILLFIFYELQMIMHLHESAKKFWNFRHVLSTEKFGGSRPSSAS